MPPKATRVGNLVTVAVVLLMLVICGVTVMMHQDEWPVASLNAKSL